MSDCRFCGISEHATTRDFPRQAGLIRTQEEQRRINEAFVVITACDVVEAQGAADRAQESLARAILENDLALTAVEEFKTNPYPKR